MIKRTAILGGRFDPPHWGHYWVAKQVLESDLKIDEVWFMPTYIHAWTKAYASALDRVKMLGFLEEEKIITSKIEISRPKTSYTIETIEELKKIPDREFFWIVGSDALADFSKWRNAAKLARKIPFIVFPRGGFPITKVLPPGFRVVKNPHAFVTNVSATFIRERLSKGLSVRGLIPENVEQHIFDNGLYQDLKQ